MQLSAIAKLKCKPNSTGRAASLLAGVGMFGASIVSAGPTSSPAGQTREPPATMPVRSPPRSTNEISTNRAPVFDAKVVDALLQTQRTQLQASLGGLEKRLDHKIAEAGRMGFGDWLQAGLAMLSIVGGMWAGVRLVLARAERRNRVMKGDARYTQMVLRGKDEAPLFIPFGTAPLTDLFRGEGFRVAKFQISQCNSTNPCIYFGESDKHLWQAIGRYGRSLRGNSAAAAVCADRLDAIRKMPMVYTATYGDTGVVKEFTVHCHSYSDIVRDLTRPLEALRRAGNGRDEWAQAYLNLHAVLNIALTDPHNDIRHTHKRV